MNHLLRKRKKKKKKAQIIKQWTATTETDGNDDFRELKVLRILENDFFSWVGS